MTVKQPQLRQHILRALCLRPGASASFLTTVSGARRQVVDDTLYTMVREGVVVDRGSGRNHCYFGPNSGAGANSNMRGAVLRLLNAITRYDGASFSDLVGNTGLSKSEVSRLAKKLQDGGAVEAIRVGSSLYYVPLSG